jgi:hypothetical protein
MNKSLKKSKGKFKKFLQTNENGKTTCQHFWDTAKAVQREKFIVIITTQKKRFQANNLRMYLKDLEKQDQANPSISRKKEKSKDQSRNKGNID